MNQPLLSFCIPVMNRLSDIQATLKKNLEDNREDASLIEFIIVCYDQDDQTYNWVVTNFSSDLSSGYLKIYKSDVLRQWHFGRAKNGFRDLMIGRIYASLDGDNFTGKNGGRHIIDVFEEHNYECVFHQFQGKWGDGTCGRISLTRDDYVELGYDDEFLPRQWDEMDALLSVLVNRNPRKYICYSGKSIASISHPFKRYLIENKVSLNIVELDPTSDPLAKELSEVAVGQHDNNYVQDDKKLRYSSIFNHLTSFFKNTKDDLLKNKYSSELVDTQRSMIDNIDTNFLLNWFLEQQLGAPLVTGNDIVLVSCIKNETFIDSWQNYYRSLGVTKFLLIDDFSEIPVSDLIDVNDTYVWRPRCGKFRYSKAFWIELLLQHYCIGTWVITVDSDEFLDLPNQPQTESLQTPLKNLVQYAGQKGLNYFCGFLVDLAPSEDSYPILSRGDSVGLASFTKYQFRPKQGFKVFSNHNTVRWSYGESADWAYRIDLRFRLNRAFDSLRKFPVFFVTKNMHLNQGFHDLIINGEKRHSSEMQRRDLLPIRHLKLFNSQFDAKSPSTKPSHAYHNETKVNLDRLRANLGQILKQASISPYTYNYFSYNFLPVPSVLSLKLFLVDDMAPPLPSFQDLVERKYPIPVVIRNGAPELDNGVIYAKSFEEGISWAILNTPFSSIKISFASFAELTVGN